MAMVGGSEEKRREDGRPPASGLRTRPGCALGRVFPAASSPPRPTRTCMCEPTRGEQEQEQEEELRMS